ncbi:hypothetical protein SAMN05216389_12618 [Oceanobacillus limi]|uniref:Uncharacterized protein n=1 Tax=Oceanobacillus limi TaxID=930131 RepID=A0A1I0H1V2_9BACI|nr:hypothetical protein [Oceanobacillus limi]SET76665.1 hypothetical protein SAMN05216389_12618 [Oceanobacillus limi]
MKEMYLQSDLPEAEKHEQCYRECRDLADVHMAHGNYELAKQRITDALKSAHELSKLKTKKKEEERYKNLLKDLVEMDVDIQIVQVHFERSGQCDLQNSGI